MRTVALTGGIASGKTTCAKILCTLGWQLVDADEIYAQLIAPSPKGEPSKLALAIENIFSGILTPQGSIDRNTLGQHIFLDPNARHRLNGITHPAIRAASQNKLDALAAAGAGFVLHDIPLLFEAGLEALHPEILLCWVPKEVQAARLAKRSGLDPNAVQARIAAQISLCDKKKRATWIIDNSGSLQNTEAQLHAWNRKIQDKR